MRRGDHRVGRLRLLLVVQCARRNHLRAQRYPSRGDMHRTVRQQRRRHGQAGRYPGLPIRGASAPAGQPGRCGDSSTGHPGGARRAQDSAGQELGSSGVPAFGQPRSSPERIHGFAVLWREREGVEPTAPTAGLAPTVLKTARTTRPHPLPRYKNGPGTEPPALRQKCQACFMLNGA